jgi:hypothetical protein
MEPKATPSDTSKSQCRYKGDTPRSLAALRTSYGALIAKRKCPSWSREVNIIQTAKMREALKKSLLKEISL